MLTLDEILQKVNDKIAEANARVGAIQGSQTGTSGRDRQFGSFGDDVLIGLDGDDRQFGNFGDDFLDGGGGDDLMTGDFGNDYMVGGEGNDRMFAGLGDDLVFGDAGDDLIDGSVGSDVLFGGAGNDNLLGGSNGDINAPEGFFEDFLVGGTGSDVLNGFGGGAGNIEIDWLVGGGAVDADGFIVDFSDDGDPDTYVLGDENTPYYASAGFDDYALIFGLASNDTLQLSTAVEHSFASVAFFTPNDTAIFAELPDGSSDLIGIVVGS